MNVEFEKSFEKWLSKITDRALLLKIEKVATNKFCSKIILNDQDIITWYIAYHFI